MQMCTLAWAAEHIGVSQRTVRRLLEAGTLRLVPLLVGRSESGRRNTALYADEVREYAKVHKVATAHHQPRHRATAGTPAD